MVEYSYLDTHFSPVIQLQNSPQDSAFPAESLSTLISRR
jgi:hypothetical protein